MLYSLMIWEHALAIWYESCGFISYKRWVILETKFLLQTEGQIPTIHLVDLMVED